jgi:arylsulfatase A-like enzyme
MSPPNVLVVTCHDLGRYLGCYGVPTVQTPHLDALAADGVRFRRAFSTAPQCSSARAALFTGRYPHSNGVLGLTHGPFGWDLHPEERHLGQVLREAGYATGLIGIHHESRGGDPERVMARCGLDELVPPGRGDEVSAHALASLGCHAEGGRPFFLHLGYHEPHRAPGPDEPDYMGFLGGYVSPDEELGVSVPPYLRDDAPARRELAEIQGAVRYVDAAVGRVLAGLRELGLAENTFVVVTTDHGLALPRAKCSLYDPGIETALIARLPARGWVGGRVLDPLVSNVDLFPTVLELAGLPVPEEVHGRSLRPLLDGEAFAPRDAVFAEMTYHDYYDPQRCVRTEHHKLIVHFAAAPSFMDPSQSWRPRSRPVVPADPATTYHPLVELYDLDADRWERTNLSDDPAQPGVRRDLLGRLHGWMADTGDPLLAGAVTSPRHRSAVAALADAGGTARLPESG